MPGKFVLFSSDYFLIFNNLLFNFHFIFVLQNVMLIVWLFKCVMCRFGTRRTPCGWPHRRHSGTSVHLIPRVIEDAEARKGRSADGGHGSDVGRVCGRLHGPSYRCLCYASVWNGELTMNC
jgi:hypothetical protein